MHKNFHTMGVFFSYTGFQQGMKLSTNHCCYVCAVVINVLEPGAFNPQSSTLSLSISYPYLIKFLS
jgi:hypothetical protein